MKIWTVTDNSDAGILTEVCLTPEARDAAVAEWAHTNWTKWKGDAPFPDSIENATDILYSTTGFLDSVHTAEHDIPLPDDVKAIITELCVALSESIPKSQDKVDALIERADALTEPPYPAEAR